MKKRVIWSNQLLNLFWSILGFGPLVYYCYQHMALTWLYIFLGVSFVPLLVPNTFIDRTQLSSSSRFYARAGIRIVRKYTQDGDLINRWLQLKYPEYSLTRRASLQQLVNKSYINEKFHLACFLFFLWSSLHALYQGNWSWVAIILVSNLIYNLYPILLQQYNRIRLRQFIKRRSLKTKG